MTHRHPPGGPGRTDPHSAPAAELADRAVQAVRDDPSGRADLLGELYDTGRPGDARLPYRRAALAFLQWQLDRGLLSPAEAPSPGSPWWRATNEALLRSATEARFLGNGASGQPSAPGVAAALAFMRQPSAGRWYRAHNMTIVRAYLDHRELAERESRVERFFLNLVLLRVLYAHALVGRPRLALSWAAPAGPLIGDPRLGMTGIFLSLSRVLPAVYPITGELERYVEDEHGFGRFLDVGMISPRLVDLYQWSAEELDLPQLTELLVDGVPAYAWDPTDRAVWAPPANRAARSALRLLRHRPAR